MTEINDSNQNACLDFDRSDEIVSPRSYSKSNNETSPMREDVSDDATDRDEELPAREISPLKRIQNSSKRNQLRN